MAAIAETCRASVLGATGVGEDSGKESADEGAESGEAAANHRYLHLYIGPEGGADEPVCCEVLAGTY